MPTTASCAWLLSAREGKCLQGWKLVSRSSPVRLSVNQKRCDPSSCIGSSGILHERSGHGQRHAGTRVDATAFDCVRPRAQVSRKQTRSRTK